MFQWTGGGINLGGNTLTNNGMLTLDNSSNVALFGSGPNGDIPVGALINSGTIVQSGAGSVVLGEFSEVAQLDNEAGATYDFTNDGSLQNSNDPGGVNNAGIIEKTAGGGTSAITTEFSNSGVIDVDTGTISLAGLGGTSTGGSFTVAQYATLDLTGGTNYNVFTGTYKSLGSGSIVLASGQINIGTGGATFDFPAGMFQWTGGDINLAGNTLTNDGTLTLDNSGDVALFGSGPNGDSPVGVLINSRDDRPSGHGSGGLRRVLRGLRNWTTKPELLTTSPTTGAFRTPMIPGASIMRACLKRPAARGHQASELPSTTKRRGCGKRPDQFGRWWY